MSSFSRPAHTPRRRFSEMLLLLQIAMPPIAVATQEVTILSVPEISKSQNEVAIREIESSYRAIDAEGWLTDGEGEVPLESDGVNGAWSINDDPTMLVADDALIKYMIELNGASMFQEQ